MAKSIFYKFLGFGRMPDHYRGELTNDNLQIVEDGLKITVTFRNYRAPGKYFKLKKYWGPGALGISKNLIIITYYNSKMLHVRLDDKRFKNIEKSFDQKSLSFKINANDFSRDASGEILIRIFPDNLQKIKDLMIF